MKKVLSEVAVFVCLFECFFLLVDEGSADLKTTKSGPSSACQPNAILMAFRWRPMMANIECWVGRFLDFSGDPDQYCKGTLALTLFFFFRGSGWGSRLPVPLWIRA